MNSRLSIENTADGYRWVISRQIDAPADSVWELFVDTSRWPQWGISISEVSCSHRYISEGMTGQVRLVGGFWVPFDITTYTDYRWTWRIGPIAATGHRVEPAGEKCRAAFEVPFFAPPYLVICWLALRKIDLLATDE